MYAYSGPLVPELSVRQGAAFQARLLYMSPIAPGRYADFVVLPEDIMTVPARRIEQMKVAMTVVGGTQVYRDPSYR